MARRRRGQFPKPTKEKSLWKIRFWTDQAQPDGSITRVRKTKCLGRDDEMTYREARKEAPNYLQPINDLEVGLEHTNKAFDQLVSQWRSAVKSTLKFSTQRQYDNWAIKKWVGPTFGDWPLSEIRRSDIQTFLTTAATTLSGKSVRDLRVVLRSLLALAVEWEWIKANPAAGLLRLPALVRTRPKIILSPQQYQQLVGALEPPYRTVIVLAALAGMRKGEIEGLRWRCVGDGSLQVEEAVYERHVGTPKSAKSRRSVSVGAMVQSALAEWRIRAPSTEPDDFVFAMRTRTPIDLHNAVARHIKPTARRLGLPAISWHDLRHTYTTWGRRAGVPVELMRDQLGHSSSMITLDVYSHIDDRAGAAAQIEGFLLANGTPYWNPSQTQ